MNKESTTNDDLLKDFEESPEEQEKQRRKRFPKNVGIVFIEDPNNGEGKTHLNFDQFASAYFLLQMNSIQDLFDFQIVNLDFILKVEKKCSKNEDEKDTTTDWLDKIITSFKNTSDGKELDIDYWIAITSEQLGKEEDLFFETDKRKSGNTLSIITSKDWERDYSPPSLFEYIAISVLTAALNSLDIDFGKHVTMHQPTKGCIFDYTDWKDHNRINVSNPRLCASCKEGLRRLEITILNETGMRIAVYQHVDRVLSREWMGSPKKRDSPMYNLKKNYKYDVDVNSGFYKRWRERTRDKIKIDTPVAIVSGLIAIALGLLANALNPTSELEQIINLLEKILQAIQKQLISP